METADDRETEVKKWLTVALAQENLENFSVEITGTSEKGDGYAGDIIFVVVRGTDRQSKSKEYNLVLKCSKSSAALLESVPGFLQIFVIETFVYQNVFSTFNQFEEEKGIEKPFDSIPKFYGAYSDEFRHVIVMENLKKAGYDLWPKGKPLTREVIEIVMKNYAKFHALSVALKDQEPDRFNKLKEKLGADQFRETFKSSGFLTLLEDLVEEVYELLKNDFNEVTLEKWLALKKQVSYIFRDMLTDADFQVIIHGDCWVNNFLYKFENKEKTDVSRVAILDWQISKLASPIADLSYFLFAGISKEDITDLDTILMDYYNHFCEYLTKLGTSLPKEYDTNTFFDTWKKYGKYGAIMCVLPIKSLYTEKEDLPDVAAGAERGEHIFETFKFNVRDVNAFKSRIRPIIEYLLKNELI